MPFAKGTRTFPSAVHKRIYITALRQTPLEVSLADVASQPSALVQSCRDYHAFVMTMLEDMYSAADDWGMKPGEYDAFLGGRKENGMKQREPAKTLALRSEAYNCVNGYVQLLMLLGVAGVPGDDGLILHVSDFAGIKKRFDKRLTPKKNTLENLIPYETRLAALARVGLAIEETPARVCVTSTRFPGMFPAMAALAKSVDKVKTFGEEGFLHCEFRQIFTGYTPKYEDVVRPLDDARREVLDALHNLALSLKMNPLCTTFWKVNYKWKGGQVLQIAMDDASSKVLVTGAAGRLPEEKARLNEMLAQESPDLQRYALRHLQYCTGCSTTHLGAFTTVLGKRKRVCAGGGINFCAFDPTAADIPYFKRYIELKRELILQ